MNKSTLFATIILIALAGNSHAAYHYHPYTDDPYQQKLDDMQDQIDAQQNQREFEIRDEEFKSQLDLAFPDNQ